MSTYIKKICFLVSTFLLATSSCFARIGDTPEISAKRYGKSTQESKGESGITHSATYQTKSYRITELYLDGKCEGVTITKDGIGRVPELPKDEAFAILELQTKGEVWQHFTAISEQNQYTETKSGLYRATYLNNQKLSIASKKLNDFLNKQKVKSVEEEL